jgi:integrase
LSDFQSELFKKKLAVKTARNIIDSSFRALHRDARIEIGGDLEGKDPFMDLKWPKVKREPPDLLAVEEKQKVLNAFLEHAPCYYPFMRCQFDTGMRPSETIALTWSDIDRSAARSGSTSRDPWGTTTSTQKLPTVAERSP